jgi:hypothetical protein
MKPKMGKLHFLWLGHFFSKFLFHQKFTARCFSAVVKIKFRTGGFERPNFDFKILICPEEWKSSN